ncbi:ABC transporter ATP-binding protein [Aquibacillus sp. 3ASR75-11]|uniref:ABC transporter ATP-binding protein n=1 Tax=Terrihalobacillus insolitus TaxID=2950438 RepID=A0A9X3WVB6_9BACI|nr:ABC transporter ATP-binding protein [Terrihalobacillus insolitus]MDC3413471.1 ABC transporter ATP-binding protein [Terrihalobacillus insolitus]MDC3425238.1 ABC transporter ATP-binding protein [Terrihalobacillus insolitus]
MEEPIIELEGLTKNYDGHPAVDQLSLTIRKGEIFGLLGPNGAGKSTSILMMLGLSEPTSGMVTVCGLNSTRNPLDVKRRVGYLPDDLGFYQQMTGLENLLYTASLNGIPKKIADERAHDLLKQVGLSDAADKKTGKYSRGMKQRLGLADVLIKDPEVIILDEPTLGIDPEGVRELLHLIKQLNEQQNITVLLSSHQLHQVQQVCDRVGIFVRGKLLAEGNLDSLAKQLFFKDSYVVSVEATPISEALIEAINQLSEVNRVEHITNTKLDIYCQSDITPVIAQKMLEHSASIYHISKKNYGLDEIYHRYFEGRESIETT